MFRFIFLRFILVRCFLVQIKFNAAARCDCGVLMHFYLRSLQLRRFNLLRLHLLLSFGNSVALNTDQVGLCVCFCLHLLGIEKVMLVMRCLTQATFGTKHTFPHSNSRTTAPTPRQESKRQFINCVCVCNLFNELSASFGHRRWKRAPAERKQQWLW